MAQATEGRPRVGGGFRMLWSSAAISSVGDGAFVVAAPLLAAFLTRDPIAVALVSAAAAAPWFMVGIWSGAVVDRLPRRPVLILSDVVRAVALVVLVVLIATDTVSTAALALVSFVVISGKVFFDAAAQATLPHVVGRGSVELTRANGRLYAGETVGQTLVGPPLGGATFGLAPWAPFVLDAASFGASAAFIARVPAAPPPATDPAQTVTAAVREGFAYLLRSRRLLTLSLSLTAYNVAYNLAAATVVLFAQDRLGVTNLGYGLLIAASAAGAVAVGWGASAIVSRLSTGGAVLASGVVQAGAWVVLALVPPLWVAGAAFALLGGASTLVTVAVVSARQQTVPDHLLGRVVSAFRLLGNGIAPIGAVAGGLLASAEGLVAPLVVAPVFLLLALLALAVPLLRSQR